jgi:hypothetical protein
MYARVAERLPVGRVTVLDVGAGPVSIVSRCTQVVDDGDFILWRPGVRRNLSRELADLGRGDPYVHERWIIWVLERQPPAPGRTPSS